jgi:hypothetical protein
MLRAIIYLRLQLPGAAAGHSHILGCVREPGQLPEHALCIDMGLVQVTGTIYTGWESWFDLSLALFNVIVFASLLMQHLQGVM